MLTHQNTKTHISGNESDGVHTPVQVDGFKVIASENMPHSDDNNSFSNSDHHTSVNPPARENHTKKTCGGLSKVEGAKKSQEEVLYFNQVLFGSVEEFRGQGSLNENKRSIDDVTEKRNEEEALHESHHADKNSNPVVGTGAQWECNESDNRPSGNLCKGLLSTKDWNNGLCKFEAQNTASKEHASSRPVSLDPSLQDEGDTNTGCSFDTAAFAVDASVDSFSQCDSVEGCWGSISDWTLTSTRDASEAHADVGTVGDTNTSFRKSTDSSDAILKQGSTYKVHCADMNEDLFEAPSFMTLVEPRKEANTHTTPTEVLPNPKPEQPNSPDSQAAWFPSLTNIVNKPQGRKRNEEIIAKVANWSSAKSPSLSRLLVEANIESKHKSMMAQKLENSQATKSHNESTPNKVHNSPSKLPITKRERKKIWLPFTCCSRIR